MKHKDIAIVIGSGPSIDNHVDEIPELISKFTCVGINQFPTKFVSKYLNNVEFKSMPVDYWAALDERTVPLLLDNCENQTLLINGHLSKKALNIVKKNKANKVLFHNSDEPIIDQGTNDPIKLYGKFSSAIPSIHFLLLQGFTKIVLFGIDNATNADGQWIHFYDESIRGEKSYDQIVDIMVQVDNLAKAFNAEIYVADRSTLICPQISVDQLLSHGNISISGEINVKEADTHVESNNNDIRNLDNGNSQTMLSTQDENMAQDKVSNSKPDKQLVINKLIKMRVPQICEDYDKVYTENATYKIVDKCIEVSIPDSRILITQGFTIV